MKLKDDSGKTTLFFVKKNIKSMIFTLVFTAIILAVISFLIASLFKQYSSTIIDNKKNQLQIICKTVKENLSLGLKRQIHNFLYFAQDTQYQNIINRATFSKSDKEKLYDEFQNYAVHHPEEISNITLTKVFSHTPVVQLNEKFYTLFLELEITEMYSTTLWRGDENELFYGIHIPVQNGYILSSYIDMNKLYEQYVSFIKLGNKGYIMLKDAEARVIMHPVKEQIGINAQTERQKLFPNKKLELDSLQEMIAKQKKGYEGAEIYYSYWWPDKDNIKLIKKISAYTPLQMGNTFFIISAVADYNEIAVQISRNMLTIIILSLSIFAGIIALFETYILSYRHQLVIKKENKYLRKINETLQTLHENENIISHQQRLQIVGTMTAGIAHEFNNLLTPIMGYSGLMLSTMSPTDENYDGVSEIFDAANKACDIIQNISQLNKRNLETVYKYCDVSELLNQAVKMANAIKPPTVDILLMVSEVKSGLYGNQTQLNQVLLNIFVNAFHAVENKKHGFLRVAYREVTQKELEQIVPSDKISNIDSKNTAFGEISITDNGCGMDKKTVARIFDPFFTTNADKGGTGLGLFVVQNIITSHRGIILCDSVLGKSTEFKIILPIIAQNDDKKQDAVKNLQIHQQKNPCKVLIIDDNIRILKLMAKGLEACNMIVCAKNSPEEGLAEIKKNDFDIILTDYSMRDLNGLSIAVHTHQKKSDIPIIVITGLLDRAIIEAKQSNIIDDYILKPVTIQALAERIDILLKNKRKKF